MGSCRSKSPRSWRETPQATIAAAARLHERIARPNLLVKIPATAEGIPAIAALIGRGLSINVTLIFSLSRYEQVIEAYLQGLETFTGRGGDLAACAQCGVVLRQPRRHAGRQAVGADRRCDAAALRGRAAIAQARLAYRIFRDRFAGPRWEKLAARGAHPQPPLWASTSTKNPDYPDTLYVDSLIGPDTINTMAESTITAFEDHGAIARTIDTGIGEATRVMHNLSAVGVDMDDVGRTLEDQGVAGFHKSFADLLDHIGRQSRQLAQQ